ncbi:MAG: hypothetical protein SGBAC_005496 [Bacillariaceae sp.]
MADPSGLIVGDAETVGLSYFPGEKGKCPPFRILYPATYDPQSSSDDGEDTGGSTTAAIAITAITASTTTYQRKRVCWFHKHGVGFFWNGYLHVVGIKEGTWLFAFLSTIIGWFGSMITFTSSVLGLNGLHLPTGLLSIDATPSQGIDNNSSNKKLPLIVFSHGLTGTGEENLLLMSAWAKIGFVVLAVHHTDGSSCRVRIHQRDQAETTPSRSSFKDMFYKHGPPFKNYDATFRPTQILHRANDIQQALEFVSKSPELASLRRIANVDEIISTGYSYGAATAVLVAHNAMMIPKDKQTIKGLILLDGWFYIDVSETAGIEFEFPQQAFPPKDNDNENDKNNDNNNGDTPTQVTPIPSVFINSQTFVDYPKIYAATRVLASKFSGNGSDPRKDQRQLDNMHVIQGTRHNNFCEVIFWIPTRLLQYMGVVGKECDPRDSYREIIQISTDFLKTTFQ